MFTKKRMILACFLVLFGIQEVMAASISTRVRVLEGKVAKQDKVMQSLQQDYASQSTQVNAELSKIRALENKVDQLIKAQDSQKTQQGASDKRYAFP